MGDVATVAALLIIPANVALAAHLWRRLRHDGNKLLLWAVMLFPCASTTLIAVGFLVSRSGESAVPVIVSWALMGAGVLAMLISIVLNVTYLKRQVCCL